MQAPGEPRAQMESAEVIVVSDVRLYREGLAHALRATERVQLVAATGRAAEAVVAAAGSPCAVVLADVAGARSLALVRELAQAAPETTVVALGVTEDDDEIVAWAEAGVAGYVTRDDSLDDLVAAVESAARGEVRCSPRIAAALLRRVSELSGGAPPEPSDARLTRRELEIVDLIGEGLANKAIARRLCIELSTVKNHVHNILEKLHVRRRADAVEYVRARNVARRLPAPH